MKNQYCSNCGERLDEAAAPRKSQSATPPPSRPDKNKSVIQRILAGWPTMLIGALGFVILSAFEKSEWGIAALISFLLIGFARESVWPFIIAVSQSTWVGWKIIIYSLAALGLFFLAKDWLAGI